MKTTLLRRHSRPAPFLLTALAAAFAGAAHAADTASAPAEPAPLLAPVTVTAATGADAPDSYGARRSSSATKLDLSRRETPQSVSVVTRAQIEDFGLASVNDVLEATPGISVERVETDRTYYTARGFDITNFQVDGVGIPFVYGNVNGDMDTVIYERVEAVRGATGLMTSSGNPSATINFVRKRPTRDTQASVNLTAGSWNQQRVEGDVAGALNATGSVRGRVVSAYENSESWLDRYALEKSVFYGVIEADLGERTTLTAGHSLQRNAPNSPLWGALPLYYTDGTPTHYDASTSTASDWSYWDSEDRRSFVELAQDLGHGWLGKASLTYQESDGNSKLFYAYGTPDRSTGLGLFSYPSRYDASTEQSIAEISASGPFSLGGREHQVTVGVNWWESELEEVSLYGQGIGTPLPPLETWNGAYPEPAFDAAINGSRFSDTQTSFFAATRLRVTDKLATLLGARIGSGDSEGTSYGVSRATSYDNEITPYAGLVYDFSDNHSVYASYTGIFAPQTEIDFNRNRLDPIEGTSVEAGVKSEFLEDRLNTAIALFRSQQDNVAEVGGTIPGSVDNYYIGVDGIEGEGVELEIAGEAAPGLQLSGGYTWLSIKDAQGQDTRRYTPKQMLRLATSYRLPALEPLRVGASLNWQDAIERDQAPGIVTRQAAYALVNLMARYDISQNLSASVNVNNVTDEKYLTSLYWSQGYYGAPRNASVTLGWKY
jgi:outer membrane receptor for ferric coprogen and ferric-rhodotorulic acid